MKATSLNNSINAINNVRMLLNELRSNLSHEETKRIRKKLRRIEAVHNVLKEKEQKDSLTSRQKNMLRNDEKYLKNISKHLKNLKKHFKKYQYGIDYLFNEDNEEDNILNNDIKAINDVRTLLNELRDNLSYEETKRIREKLYKKEAVYNFLIEKDSLTNKEKKVLRNIDRYLKNISKHLKNLKKHFKKIQYDIDYLFNELVTSNDAINEFKNARKLLNERRSNLLLKETNEIRKKLHKKEAVYNFLKEKEQNGSLTMKKRKY